MVRELGAAWRRGKDARSRPGMRRKGAGHDEGAAGRRVVCKMAKCRYIYTDKSEFVYEKILSFGCINITCFMH